MRFYGYFRSSAAFRCRIAFNLKGVQPSFVPIHLRLGKQRDESFLQVNPQGLVPALETGGRVLTQSLAVIEWLDETVPAPPLLPRAPLDRAYVRSLALLVACDIHPLQNLRVLNYLKSSLEADQDVVDRWCQHWIARGLADFEQIMQREGTSGQFCFGDAPTLADICLAPQLFSAARFGVKIVDLPLLQRLAARYDQHPAFQAAHPSRQPDTEA